MEFYRSVDIVFCIDASAAMAPILEEVKRSVIRICEDIQGASLGFGANIDQFRVRTIVFRDYEDPSNPAEHMAESDFFYLPEDRANFEEILDGIDARGGGDGGKNGLEALYLAMRSDFVQYTPRDRQIIVLFTNSDALPLLKRSSAPDYPSGIPDEAGLAAIWLGSSNDPDIKLLPRLERMIIFAPPGTHYEEFASIFPSVIFQPLDADGLGSVDFSALSRAVLLANC